MSILDSITGKAVETKLREYSEVYGEVLLGLHKELENNSRLLQDYRQQLKNHERYIKQLMILCVVSLLFTMAIGVVVWSIR